jgi:Beta-ketoacyl synthase, N-terminal domain/Beta-ketoacyl synthase, C-terminal domain
LIRFFYLKAFNNCLLLGNNFQLFFLAFLCSESVGMDPQTRLLLEKAFEASSSITTGVSDQTGVYIGCMYTEYLDGILGPAGLANSSASSITGHGLSFMVGRLSFTFGWQGPCISTDTACSSSLVALHLAHQGIVRHESEFALAGGVNVMLIPQTTLRICLLQALSLVGRCKALDASSDGYGRGEALCVGILASSTHPDISAIIKGSAVQQNGTSSGLTAPNGPSQSALIRQALLMQRTSAATLAAVSLHGTGTPLGDPIEIGALSTALGSKHGTRNLPLAIGASKTCFGHTEGTAGMTGTLLALNYLQEQISAPIVNLRSLNPYVQPSLSNIAAYVPRQAAPTMNTSTESCAGTSSFGMSGVNAHAIFSLIANNYCENNNFNQVEKSLYMERSRCWPLPLLHPLIGGAAAAASRIEFSIRSHAFLHEHQVFGRAIMPASGMFEIINAVASIGIEQNDANPLGAITGAAIQSALPLNNELGNIVLKASLHHDGVFIMNGSRGIIHIQAGYTKLLKIPQTSKTMAPDLSPLNYSGSALSNIFSNNKATIVSEGNNFAELASCPTPHLKFFANPASLDACIHLAPVPRAGEPLQETKVPTAVGGFLLSGKTRTRGRSWASARTISLNEGLSNISWFSAAAQHQLVDLVARPMAHGVSGGGKNIEIDVSTECTYTIEWQASEHIQKAENAEDSTSTLVLLDEERIQIGNSTNCSGIELSAKLLSIAQQV